MRFGYADPPYMGQAVRCYAEEAERDGRTAREVNHRLLVNHLCDEFPDGWALSCSSPSLEAILPLVPRPYHVGIWTKTFASFKPNVNPAFAWEPVIFRGGRQRGRDENTVRDWVSCRISTEKGVKGAKPWQFCHWIFDFLGLRAGVDELVDLFPGSGAVGEAWERFSMSLDREMGKAIA